MLAQIERLESQREKWAALRNRREVFKLDRQLVRLYRLWRKSGANR